MPEKSKTTPMALELEVQFAADSADALPAERDIETWVRAALEGRSPGGQLVVRIVGEREGRELNERYRQRTGPTNVLSFPFENPGLLQPPLLGDIVLCAPVVRREAIEQDKAPQAHWAHLVVHGVLHLLGYDHEDERQAADMERLEKAILASLGYPDPYESEITAEDAPVPDCEESNSKVRTSR